MFNLTPIILEKGVYISRKEISASLSELLLELSNDRLTVNLIVT